jgi:hypothetical protein
MAPIIDLIESSEIPIRNIYNWDETGLFYRGLPRYTLASGDDDGAGTKEDKRRITVMLRPLHFRRLTPNTPNLPKIKF